MVALPMGMCTARRRSPGYRDSSGSGSSRERSMQGTQPGGKWKKKQPRLSLSFGGTSLKGGADEIMGELPARWALVGDC